MNTRARVKAIPVAMAAVFGYSQLGFPSQVFAQDSAMATPAAAPTGYDEINLTIEESGVTGMPETLEANRYLVKVTGPKGSGMDSVGAIFLQPPDEMTPQQVYDSAMEHPDDMPDWYLKARWNGGATVGADGTGWTVLDLDAGKWIVTTINGTTLGVEFEVTGELADDLVDPDSNVTVELAEMSITVKEGAFAAGNNVLHVQNIGGAIHFLDIGKIPDGTTHDQVAALMDSMMSGSPEAGGLSENDMTPVGHVEQMSGQLSQWVPMTLEAGTYFLACWVPDAATGMPHALMGMWDVVEVS